jgi:hypothetical protein
MLNPSSSETDISESRQNFVTKNICIAFGDPLLSSSVRFESTFALFAKSMLRDYTVDLSLGSLAILLFHNGENLCSLMKNRIEVCAKFSQDRKNYSTYSLKFVSPIYLLLSLEELNQLDQIFKLVFSAKSASSSTSKLSSENFQISVQSAEIELLDSNTRTIRPLLRFVMKDSNFLISSTNFNLAFLAQVGFEALGFDSQFNCWESILEPFW